MEETDKLSTKEHWDKVLNKKHLPIIASKKNYNHLITMRFTDKVLKNEQYKTFMEVGCGSSAWMPYFAKTYNYQVSGIDYSEIGCQIAIENLKFQNIEIGEVLCADIFSDTHKFNKKFDVIFSYGFIEHFSEPEKIIGIMKNWLAPSGVIITLVPNLYGITAWMAKTFCRTIFEMHIPIDKDALAKAHTDVSLEIVDNSYTGILSLAVIPWENGDHWLLKKPFRIPFLFCVRALDFALSMIMRQLPTKLSSKNFSPYITCIAKG